MRNGGDHAAARQRAVAPLRLPRGGADAGGRHPMARGGGGGAPRARELHGRRPRPPPPLRARARRRHAARLTSKGSVSTSLIRSSSSAGRWGASGAARGRCGGGKTARPRSDRCRSPRRAVGARARRPRTAAPPSRTVGVQAALELHADARLSLVGRLGALVVVEVGELVAGVDLVGEHGHGVAWMSRKGVNLRGGWTCCVDLAL